MPFPRWLGRSTFRFLIASLAAVLVCVPALKRAAERTPIHKDTPGFKFSKTLELPHKKAGSTVTASIRTEGPIVGAGAAECAVPLQVLLVPHGGAPRPTPSRAPPLVVAL